MWWWLHLVNEEETATNATTVPMMQLTAFEDYCGAI